MATILSLQRARRGAGGGTWVLGRPYAPRFDALVFPRARRELRLRNRRQPILEAVRVAFGPRKRTDFNWDRGPDVVATDATAHAIVDFLCARLADRVFRDGR